MLNSLKHTQSASSVDDAGSCQMWAAHPQKLYRRLKLKGCKRGPLSPQSLDTSVTDKNKLKDRILSWIWWNKEDQTMFLKFGDKQIVGWISCNVTSPPIPFGLYTMQTSHEWKCTECSKLLVLIEVVWSWFSCSIETKIHNSGFFLPVARVWKWKCCWM